MMETRNIDRAISLLERAETNLARTAKTSDDYRFLKDLLSTAKDAKKELDALNRGEHVKTVYVGEEPYAPSECHCNADNAPCNWCRTHCEDCAEHDDECAC